MLPNHLGPVLQGLGQVRRLDVFAARQVGDGAGKFHGAVVGARRQVELTHRGADEIVACFVQFAKLAHLGHAHVGIADNTGVQSLLTLRVESFQLPLNLCKNNFRFLKSRNKQQVKYDFQTC
jgi:hypothetical protein